RVGLDHLEVLVAVGRVGVAGPEDVVLFDVGEQPGEEGVGVGPLERDGRGRDELVVGAVGAGGGQKAGGVVDVVGGDGDLLEVVLAPHAGGGLADLLDGGQEQADEDGDDGYHHQQLDQREGAPSGTVRRAHGSDPQTR